MVKCNAVTGHTSCNMAISYSPFDSSKAIAEILSFRCCEPKGINTPLNKKIYKETSHEFSGITTTADHTDLGRGPHNEWTVDTVAPIRPFLFLTILNTGHVHKGKQAMPNPRHRNVWVLYMHAQTYVPQTHTYYRFIHQRSKVCMNFDNP